MQHLRPVGLEEMRCVCRDVLGLYGAIVVTGTYRAPQVLSSVPREAILNALKACILEHPMLSAIILEAESTKPMFARPDSIDLEDHLRISDDGEGLDEFLRRIHNDQFEPLNVRPPWRAYVRSTEPQSLQVAFATSHTIADGRSCLFFHQTFLRALNENNTEPASTTLNTATCKPLPPSLLKTAKLPLSLSYLVPVVFKEFGPRFITSWLAGPPETYPWKGSSVRPSLPEKGSLLHTNIRSVTIPPDVLKTALDCCRSHGVRLTAFVSYLTALSVAAALASRDKPCPRLRFDTALDLRPLLPEYQNCMANIVSSILDDVVPTNDQDQMWKAMRISTDRLAKSASTLNDQLVALLAYVGDYWSFTRGRATKQPEVSFSISNLGVFDGSGERWQVTDMIFSESASGVGGPFNVDFASAKGGGLTVTMSWMNDMLGVSDEELFMAEVTVGLKQRIEELIK